MPLRIFANPPHEISQIAKFHEVTTVIILFKQLILICFLQQAIVAHPLQKGIGMEDNTFQNRSGQSDSNDAVTRRQKSPAGSGDGNGTRTLEEMCRRADQLFFSTLFLNHQGGCAMSTTTIQHTVNGVNVEQLQDNITAIQGEPSLAKFQFRATNSWINGGHNRTTIKEFYGVGKEDTTRTEPFVLDADEPPVLLGEDQGANPVEFVLHALASCLTTSMVYHAAARGIKIDSVESRLEGDLDLRGFLGLSKDIRPGYQTLRVHFTVKSDAPAETLRELTKHSPVFDIVSNPVPVAISVNTEGTN